VYNDSYYATVSDGYVNHRKCITFKIYPTLYMQNVVISVYLWLD